MIVAGFEIVSLFIAVLLKRDSGFEVSANWRNKSKIVALSSGT
jgi:hypothetical protein